MFEDIKARNCYDLIKAVNHENTFCDEYGALAAYDALMEDYGLNRCKASPTPKRRTRADSNASRQGDGFLPLEGREPPRRE